jgi:spore maturation protein CgeB
MVKNSHLGRYMEYPKFHSSSCTIVMLDTGYLTVADCIRGFEKSGHRVFTIAPGEEFIRRLLTLLVEVKPDFLMAVNHLGFDEEGKLTELLSELKLPFASWYVDSPTYVLKDDPRNVSNYCAVFCWDSWYLDRIEGMGYESPVKLPLATDPDIFKPLHRSSKRHEIPLSFVGNSMKFATETWRKKFSPVTYDTLKTAAVPCQLESRRLLMGDILRELGEPGGRDGIDLEAALIWEATKEYRLRLVEALIPLGITVYGDDGWSEFLSDPRCVRDSVDYYTELPRLFNDTCVNFNATSFQMKHAVNQRVFDVAACGAFLLTDRMPDLENFFEIGSEAVCYESVEEAVELSRYYLKRPAQREKIAGAARTRVLAEHTYTKRMSFLIDTMRERFA